VLNTLTEHDFQDAFKKWQSAGNWKLQGWWWSISPKLGFGPDGSISPGNYGWLFVIYVWSEWASFL
jgi:hypothetical protein